MFERRLSLLYQNCFLTRRVQNYDRIKLRDWCSVSTRAFHHQLRHDLAVLLCYHTLLLCLCSWPVVIQCSVVIHLMRGKRKLMPNEMTNVGAITTYQLHSVHNTMVTFVKHHKISFSASDSLTGKCVLTIRSHKHHSCPLLTPIQPERPEKMSWTDTGMELDSVGLYWSFWWRFPSRP